MASTDADITTDDCQDESDEDLVSTIYHIQIVSYHCMVSVLYVLCGPRNYVITNVKLITAYTIYKEGTRLIKQCFDVLLHCHIALDLSIRGHPLTY